MGSLVSTLTGGGRKGRATYVPPARVIAPVAAAAPTVTKPDNAESGERASALVRRNAARQSVITSSEQGVLAENAATLKPARKVLLGE
jgi:predicted small lipoprotein YifL